MFMSIQITLDPAQRKTYLDTLLANDGLTHIEEDPDAAYCPISLTQTPELLKPYVQQRQDILMNKVLAAANITAYDPASAPYSPDTNLTSQPDEVYLVDSSKIVGARFFVGHNLLPSTGYGVEAEKAKLFNRISVILVDANVRVSRMQPHRAIYLQYSNFLAEHEKFIPVFELLRQYEPGMGFDNGVPALLGFGKDSGKVVNLEREVYSQFPELQYKYDGTKAVAQLDVTNPEIFYEYRTKGAGPRA